MAQNRTEIRWVHSPIEQIRENPLLISVTMIPVIAAFVTLWADPGLRNLAIAIFILGLIGGQRKYGWLQALLMK